VNSLPNKSLVALICVVVSSTTPVWAIKKCKDDQGKWHYGDVAETACNKSEVTTLNERGFVVSQDQAPKTPEQLVADKRRQAAEIEQARLEQAELNEKRRLLSVYETEADIDRLRDNQLDAVQGNIDVHNAYLNDMQIRLTRYQTKLAESQSVSQKDQYVGKIQEAQNRIDSSKLELRSLIEQKKSIAQRFAKEKKLYLSLKDKST
jgi:hypothetical protein